MNHAARVTLHRMPTTMSVAGIGRDQLFKLTADNTHIYALLQHENQQIADGPVRWAVVIDSQPGHIGRKLPGTITQIVANATCNVVLAKNATQYEVL